MIDKEQAKKCCCDDISFIENYERARRDLLHKWHLIHRKELEGFSRRYLRKHGMWYNRPAEELAFSYNKIKAVYFGDCRFYEIDQDPENEL